MFENIHPIPRLSGALRVRFAALSTVKASLARVTLHPVFTRIRPRRPAPARTVFAERVRDRVVELSKALGRTRWRQHGEDLVLELRTSDHRQRRNTSRVSAR